MNVDDLMVFKSQFLMKRCARKRMCEYDRLSDTIR